MARIEKLVVENYRGASTRLEVNFETSKAIALVFGENGTGKTTIADALDAIGNCSKGSLEDKSSTRARDHLPTIGKKPADIRIELVAGKEKWNAILTGDSFSVSPEARPIIRVLRRSKLQQLIEAQPAQRYEALRHFIDVDNVERSENALRDAASAAKSDVDLAVQRRVEAEAQLQRVWEAEGKFGIDAFEWAKSIAELDTTILDQEVQSLRHAQTSITKAEDALAELNKAIINATQKDIESEKVEQEVEKLPGADARQTISLTGILKQVNDYLLLGTSPDECPVCRQGIPLDELKADIHARLVDLKQYDELRLKCDSVKSNIQVAQQAIEPKQSALLIAARTLLGIVRKGEINTNINEADYVEIEKKDDVDITRSIVEAEQLIIALSAQKNSLGDNETATSKRSGLINSIRVQYDQVQESKITTETLSNLQKSLQEAYDIVRLTRIAYTQQILDEVASECNRLHAIIHPNEPIAISKLALDLGKRASLSQAATFEGFKDVPPQAYFSESHLDTLGFCFWLAIAKRESLNTKALIVLDDIFTSIDAQHINRIAQLLTDESQHFLHIIITTHQRLWRDIYRYQHGAGKLTQLIDLQRWSLSKGITSYKTRLAVDELIASIVVLPFDRQITASKAGVLLEATLDYLALQYRCRVARTHDGSYTLGELMDGTESLFKKLEIQRPELDAEGFPNAPPKYNLSNVTGITNQLRGLTFLRNQVGAHFNIAGLEIADSDVQLFADLTVKLAESLSCTTCGQIPGKKLATYFQCSCTAPHEVRMQPLQL